VKTPPIQNSLLRIDDVPGDALKPSERPNEKLDFWVLELQCHYLTVAKWCSVITQILKRNADILVGLHKKGYPVILFITPAENVVCKLSPELLGLLSELNINLEISFC
jgi:hypothetical protein